jgi:cellulose synthase/poly-beta-1,6-N-acetylglucosamine synthase-like glycosyltransferase
VRIAAPLSFERPLLSQPTVIVAAPAKNESQRLPAFLKALAEQTDAHALPLARGSFAVVLFVNNSSDASAETAHRIARGAPFEIQVIEATLPAEHSHAGGARRAAMDLAAAWLGEVPGGIILTTDADSRVTPNWISANIKAFAEGADAVLGTVSLDEDGKYLPAQLHARGRLESVYGDLLTELSAQLDPEDCNPWPHHATISGASLAVTRRMYLQVGGVPRTPLGEDRAFVAVLRRCDARIRFALDVQVITSARVVGRAPGGVADTLCLRSEHPEAICDEALEPVAAAFKRSLWRGRLRRCGVENVPRWYAALRVPAEAVRRAQAASAFGEAWETIEQTSGILRRRCLTPTDLPRQIALANRWLCRLTEPLTTNEDVKPVLGASITLDDFDEPAQAFDEKIGGLVPG